MRTYTPKYLIETRKKICEIHRESVDLKISASDTEVEKLIRRLVKISSGQLYRHSLILTRKELIMVTRYLPYNYYHVDMRNLFEVFRLRCDTQLCRILFEEWQNSYANEACNHFMRELFQEQPIWREMMLEKHIEPEMLSGSMPIDFLRKVYENKEVRSQTWNEKTAYFGIGKNTELYLECCKFRYMFCAKKEYDLAGAEVLLWAIKHYKKEYLMEFLEHFLESYSLQELHDASYLKMAQYLLTITGEPESRKWREFFWNIPGRIQWQYRYWVNIYKVNEFFGLDERSSFWKNYQIEGIKRYKQSNSVVMEFAKDYVVEFLGKANGPMYVYGKENGIFDSKIRRLFTELDNGKIRKYLYEKQDLAKERKLHNPGWQKRFAEYLEEHKIAKKINSM